MSKVLILIGANIFEPIFQPASLKQFLHSNVALSTDRLDFISLEMGVRGIEGKLTFCLVIGSVVIPKRFISFLSVESIYPHQIHHLTYVTPQ